MRDLWERKVQWDDALPEDLLSAWIKWKTNLDAIEDVHIPRHFGNGIAIKDWKEIELHLFCDASENGHGAAAYLRYENENCIHCSFVIGKSRCAPIKPLTIPRLELQSAVLATRLFNNIKEQLPIDFNDVIFWSDSKTALAYINNEARRFKTFIANRVAEIRESTNSEQWRHCPGHLNVADDASRGLDPTQFSQKDCRWINGPSFLWKPRNDWPTNTEIPIQHSDLEFKSCATKISQEDEVENSLDVLMAREQSWVRMKRIVARCFQFINSCRKKTGSNAITTQNLMFAETVLIKRAQEKSYSKEIEQLKKKKNISNQSKILKLCPVMNSSGVMCLGSRLKFADLPEDAKQPTIIPAEHPITRAIIVEAHKKSLHGGVELIMSNIRQRYWIPKLRSLVRKMSLDCITCRKQLATPMQQLMAPLPTSRVTMSLPFENTGVDYFGPFYVKVKRSTVKRWGCIFTCFSTRAVHLETTSSLDTDRFINVLRRFQARRGNPKHIYSDNGTNFIGAEKEIKLAINEWNHDVIETYLQQEHSTWHFNPPAAPHMGGVWERIIQSVKKSLRAILNKQIVDPETFDTVIVEIEGILNSRPLTHCSDDPKDLEPLTPNHFLLQKSSPSLPPGKFRGSDVLLRKNWRRAQALTNSFWQRWQREYLSTLAVRSKWLTKRRSVQTDDLVLVVDDNVPRGAWKVGRVLKTMSGADGSIRSVLVKTGSGDLVRPIVKLCLLEGSE